MPDYNTVKRMSNNKLQEAIWTWWKPSLKERLVRQTLIPWKEWKMDKLQEANWAWRILSLTFSLLYLLEFISSLLRASGGSKWFQCVCEATMRKIWHDNAVNIIVIDNLLKKHTISKTKVRHSTRSI